MKLTARANYACRALLELSLHWPQSVPVQIGEIAKKQNIPIKFLTHILINLKQLGLVESTRGKSGGYILRKAPQEIRLYDAVMHFMEGTPQNTKARKQTRQSEVIDMIWEDFDKEMIRFLQKITFEEIVMKARNLEKVQMFTI